MLIGYSNFSEIFTMHTDNNKMQLGVLISQNGKLITFWSRKLTPSQIIYMTTEWNLLSIL